MFFETAMSGKDVYELFEAHLRATERKEREEIQAVLDFLEYDGTITNMPPSVSK